MRLTTPALTRNKYFLQTKNMQFCLAEVKQLWSVPKEATRFWFRIINEPEDESVQIELRLHKNIRAVFWRKANKFVAKPHTFNPTFRTFADDRGIFKLLKGKLKTGEWTPVNVILLYE